ncbi:AfsR/SARP family transcriptional regulator [Bailinhaonella thermotolerans]|uniref:Transcriptional regulator n=1 Tax=Bailinhaonella thermotolerans TaxID=1070861 RepID=A0A3A4B6H1_9ACTN|nr:AfsR/SARP family transcriptional regulator [Bailinhaonella thermotolerans]RJL36230.1 transcriptional regulator [Bailinhaonella thermotolerans]
MEVVHEGRCHVPSAQKVRCTLALLLLSADHIVPRETLIDELWGERPPRTMITTLQTYIYQLRKSFSRLTRRRDVILTRAPGYAIRLGDDDEVDAHRFERLVEQGRRQFEQGRLAEASHSCGTALALWRGEALAGICAGHRLEGHIAHLEELRIRALELRVGADMLLGNDRDLIPELRALVAAHPLHEWFHGELIKALAGAGRRGEALHAYRVMCRTLRDELGLEPSPAYQNLQRDLLRGVDVREMPGDSPLRHVNRAGMAS